MCESIDELVAGLQKFVVSFDPRALDREEFKQLFDKFVLVERLGAAGKALTGLRAAETNVWWDGHRSSAHYMADKSKCTVAKEGGPTTLYNLALLCHHHHRLKTFHGYRLQHYRYRWVWLGPNDPPPDEDADQPELTTFFSQKEFALMGMG